MGLWVLPRSESAQVVWFGPAEDGATASQHPLPDPSLCLQWQDSWTADIFELLLLPGVGSVS